jgi:hypothetical protein
MRSATDGSSNIYFPGAALREALRRRGIEGRKQEFAELNELARACGDGWLVSVAGDVEVRVECLPSSDLPQRLQRAGYELRPDGQGQRILAHAIVERFGRGADGVLVPITQGSTLPVVSKRTHAGIVGVQRYSFLL